MGLRAIYTKKTITSEQFLHTLGYKVATLIKEIGIYIELQEGKIPDGLEDNLELLYKYFTDIEDHLDKNKILNHLEINRIFDDVMILIFDWYGFVNSQNDGLKHVVASDIK
ncbi:hypothetical protein KHQ81_15675 (plasmid) [Mycoplasmatota bacterium]|nr:hypothetical protein KHQ81_15675 [Mycoplasmatota bacterium]